MLPTCRLRGRRVGQSSGCAVAAHPGKKNAARLTRARFGLWDMLATLDDHKHYFECLGRCAYPAVKVFGLSSRLESRATFASNAAGDLAGPSSLCQQYSALLVQSSAGPTSPIHVCLHLSVPPGPLRGSGLRHLGRTCAYRFR